MDSDIQNFLYQELMFVLTQMEDGDIRGAKSYLESLINKIQYNQL